MTMTTGGAPQAVTVANRPGITCPKAVIFDWDNTLVETWPVIHAALTRTFERFGLVPWTFEETRRRVRKSMRESFPPLFGERWEEAGAFFKDAFTAIHLDMIEPADGAATMLAELAGRGIYLGVVSNKHGELLRDEARHLGWSVHFARLVGAFDAERDKPAPDPVHLALAGSGITCGPEVWFAGDTDVDIECAANAGCLPVLVRSDPPGNGEFDVGHPALYVKDCRTLSELIREL